MTNLHERLKQLCSKSSIGTFSLAQQEALRAQQAIQQAEVQRMARRIIETPWDELAALQRNPQDYEYRINSYSYKFTNRSAPSFVLGVDLGEASQSPPEQDPYRAHRRTYNDRDVAAHMLMLDREQGFFVRDDSPPKRRDVPVDTPHWPEHFSGASWED